MPKITQYDAGETVGLHPTEIGINATAAAARRLQGDYSEAAAAISETGRQFGSAIKDAGDVSVKYIDHQQISTGARSFAELIDGKTKEWEATPKDPNDPTTGKRFIEENLEPSLQKFKSGFITENSQKWAETHVDQFRQHMYAKTSADMATLAGEAVKVNHRMTVNGLASAVYNDPTSLDFALQTLESTTDSVVGSSPNLTTTAAAKIKGELLQNGKEQIIKSAVSGIITKNPNVDLSAIQQKYGEYITGAEIGMFAKAAKVQAKSDLLADKQIQTYERQQAEQRAHTDANKNFSDNVTIDPNTNRPIIKPGYFQGALNIAQKNPNAPNAATIAKTYLDWGEHQQNLKDEAVRDNPTVRQDLISRIGAADKATSEIEILRAETNHEITRTTSNDLLKLQKAVAERPDGEPIRRGRDEFFKRYAPTIDPSIGDPNSVAFGHHTALGLQKMYEAQMDARKQESDLRAKGLDPALIYDPRSEYFFGKPENLMRYRATMQDAAAYQAKLGEKNLTGPGKIVTGVSVSEPSSFRAPDNWQFSPSRQQYRDPTGKLYDMFGKPVK